MANPHVVYAVTQGSSVVLDEIVASDINLQSRMGGEGADGGIETLMLHLDEQKPEVNVTSLAIARALALTGISALPVTSTPLDFWLQRMEQDAVRSSGANHYRVRMTVGFLVPQRLRVEQSGIAQIELKAGARYNGSANPLILTGATALVGTPAADQQFTLGPVMINGVQVPNVVGWELDFGLELYNQVTDGNIWPTFQAVLARMNSRLTVRTREAVALSTFGLVGTAQGATDSIAYLRKKNVDGTGNVADATAEHIAISMAAGHIRVENTRSQFPQPYESEIILTPRYNGTDPTWAVSTASAIS